MIADENHYKSHWEFFQSVNPKADELFFVELQINEFDKRIKEGLKEIDFANDVIDTPESYENDLKRKDFFFHKEYKEFLEGKFLELKSKKDLKHLPNLENSIIVHYGCSDFNSTEHKVYWIGAISHTPNKVYFFESRNEVEVIEKFEKYIQENKNKTFIHWSMNSPKFGFRAIENRYFDLTNIGLKAKKEIDLMPKKEIDLSEFLKNKYGINYIDRKNGRLNNLAKLNNFSGIQSEVEVININDATNRLELLFSIVQAEIQGNLKTFQPQPVQKTPRENESKFSFVNNFDFVDSNEVYNYFSEKLVSKRMLNESELQEYLIQAFQECTPPKELFDIKLNITKQRIYNIFYTYYNDKAKKPHGRQREYVDLLGKYFKGFNSKTIASNWSK